MFPSAVRTSTTDDNLPPYITHKLEDKNRYQTVYAKHEGSAAAPTAGLHFTTELLEKINFDRYLEYMHGQVKELVTGYGKLDLLWFDFSYDDMTGEKWKATELIKMVRSYQPDDAVRCRLKCHNERNPSP